MIKKFDQIVDTDYGQFQARGFHYEDGSFVMYFVDIPGAVVEGKSVEETIINLKAALEAILDMFLEEIQTVS